MFGDLFGKIQQMQSQLAQSAEKLAEIEVTGLAEGGLIKVKANGKKKILDISISPSLAGKENIEELEDLLVTAINRALEQADTAQQAQMQGIKDELLPGFDLNGL